MKYPILTYTILTLLLLLLHPTAQQQGETKCHYSCSNCTQPYHQYCRACKEGFQFEVVKNPGEIPVEYRDSRVPTGVCSRERATGGTNALGLVLLISACILIPVTRSNLLFYITSTLQSLSLIRLLQISWLHPTSYLLQSFQYLSPCNTFTSDLKQTSWQLKAYSFSYLDQLYIQPQLEKSLLLLGSLNVVVVGLLVVAHLTMVCKRKYFLAECRLAVCLAEWALKNEIAFLSTLFYFLIQETILSYVVALQFTHANSFLIGTLVFYSLLIVIFCIYTYRIRMRLFQNRLIQYYSYSKKIIYPIFIVVPFQFQYFLLILMGLNCAMQAFFDYHIKSYPLKSRWMGYKVLEFITIVFLGIFYGIDRDALVEGTATGMNYAVAVVLCANIGFFFVEVGLSIKEKLQAQDKKQQEDKVQVPEMSMMDRGHNNTLQLATTKRQQRRESTQSDLMDNSNIRHGIEKLNQSIDEPPKIQRSDTKDSSFKKSKQDKEGNNSGLDNIEQISEIKIEKEKEKEGEKDGKLMSKDNSKKKHKTNQQMKSELRKRYGV